MNTGRLVTGHAVIGPEVTVGSGAHPSSTRYAEGRFVHGLDDSIMPQVF